MRMRWPLPEKPRKYRLPLPRWLASGQALFWQQKCSIGCWWAACIAQLLVHARLVVLPLLSHSKHRCLPSSDTTCRRIWPLLTDPRSRKAVETAERFCDGLASLMELQVAAQEAYAAIPTGHPSRRVRVGEKRGVTEGCDNALH